VQVVGFGADSIFYVEAYICVGGVSGRLYNVHIL
jgi:hypothetical protein